VSDGLRIDPAGLSRHAAGVVSVADLADQARSAAAGMDLGGGAFGILCSFMVPPLQLVSTPAVGFLSAVAETLRYTGDALTSAAEGFADTEQQVTAGFERMWAGPE